MENNQQRTDILSSIFSVTAAGFDAVALEVFRYQVQYNSIYGRYVKQLNVAPDTIVTAAQIPFLPVEFFKEFKLLSGFNNAATVFTSSGTSGTETSKHYVPDISVYETAFRKGFEKFYGAVQEYCVLALLPAYLEREGSSLIYMAADLIRRSGHGKSGFYLKHSEQLHAILTELKERKQKTILLGVTFALLDFAHEFPIHFPELIVMETGGMKGRKKELLREEVHEVLRDGFGVPEVHSEYGMTELLSQAYSKGSGVFHSPQWMKILIRDTNDPFALVNYSTTGGINVIDLANIDSCAFIATQDLGKMYPDGSFEVLGRFDSSDVRGCNLLVI
ncbi:MAG TPA: acyl transferase [Bacteroidia bacterium]|nr:acyl transferase [Bacteroidia bacterium]